MKSSTRIQQAKRRVLSAFDNALQRLTFDERRELFAVVIDELGTRWAQAVAKRYVQIRKGTTR